MRLWAGGEGDEDAEVSRKDRVRDEQWTPPYTPSGWRCDRRTCTKHRRRSTQLNLEQEQEESLEQQTGSSSVAPRERSKQTWRNTPVGTLSTGPSAGLDRTTLWPKQMTPETPLTETLIGKILTNNGPAKDQRRLITHPNTHTHTQRRIYLFQLFFLI